MEFQVLSSQIMFRGRVFNVRQDRLLMPDGNQTQIDIVEHLGAVTMIPVDEQGQIWFVRQYRHAIGVKLLELPAGAAEEGEDIEIGAQRELREEIGMAAHSLHHIGSFYLAPGYSSERMHVFLASDLYPDPLPGDDNEFLAIEKIPARQALSLAESRKLEDSKTLIALHWARPYLAHSGLI
jgi:ADP-ribose pyrophosphatase